MFDEPHSRRHRRPARTEEPLTPSADRTLPPSVGAEPPRPGTDPAHGPPPAGLSAVLPGHLGPHGEWDGPRYVLLRSNDGDLYLWCPYDRDPRTGASIRQLIPVVAVAEEARSPHRSAPDGKDGELAELRRLVGELGLQVAALREQLAASHAVPGRRAPVVPGGHAPDGHLDAWGPELHARTDELTDPRRDLATLLEALHRTLPDNSRR